jgi:hypothetical protein
MVAHLDIHLAEIGQTLPDRNAAGKHVALAHLQVVFQVQYGLLPVGGLLEGRS